MSMLFRILPLATALGVVSALTISAWADDRNGPPADLAAQIRAIGPVINVPAVMKIYGPLLANQPKGGVTRTNDLVYGPAERNRLDVFAPDPRPAQPVPTLIFVHGGAFQFGDRKANDNKGYYFARNGLLTLVPSYRLAPKDKWPSGPEDVARMVAWASANAAKYGGDPNRIFIMGESAGAVHVAGYAFMKRFHPASGPGVAGVILISGLYNVALELEGAAQLGLPTPNKTNENYFGHDFARYPEMSTVLHLDGPTLPVFVSYADLDPTPMQIEAGELFAALCQRDHECPTLNRVSGHDHLSQVFSINTGDETLSGPVLDFIRATRDAPK